MSDPTDMEALAAQEHESWTKWTKWMLGQIDELMSLPSDDPNQKAAEDYAHTCFNILPCVKRWRRQMATPYAELSEKEKESDRKVVREKLALYRPESLPELIATALDAAHTAGMESAAEMEGVSWTGNGVEKADLAAGDARQILLEALGVD